MTGHKIAVGEAARFGQEKMAKVDLARGEQLMVGLNCFEPGQSQKVHRHQDADKFYLIVSGKARMQVGTDAFEATAGELVWAPADAPHGVLEALERTVMLVGLAPPPRPGSP